MPPARRSISERFWAKVSKPDGDGACWIWNAALNEHGYGLIARGGKCGGMALANRVSWEINEGPIPDGLCVLHHCDNPPCVNPDHLWLGTRADNNADMIAKGRAVHDGLLGEQNGQSKLNEAQVREIRTLYAVGGITQTALALKFDVHHSLISLIIRGKAWAHV